MKGKKLKSVLMYIVLFCIFFGLYYALRWFYSTRTETEYERPISPVEIIYPEIRTVENSVTLSSFIDADSIIPVTPYVEGTIIEYYVTEGDYVKEGDVIAKIDPEPYRLQRDQAEAAYLGYESSFERVANLYKTDSASKQDYDTVKAQRDAMKAQLDLAELQLSYTDIVAHAEGTVLKTVSSKGSTAVKGTPVAMIADLDNLVVNLNLGEQYYSLFKDGADYPITITRPKTDYSDEVSTTAHIKSVSPYIDSSSRNFKLYLTVDDPSLLRPGMFVKVKVTTSEKSGYSLNKSAIKLDGSAYYVDEDSIARYIDLSDAYSNDDYVILPEGYEDKAFIIKGQSSIFAGQQVDIVEGE